MVSFDADLWICLKPENILFIWMQNPILSKIACLYQKFLIYLFFIKNWKKENKIRNLAIYKKVVSAEQSPLLLKRLIPFL